MIEVKHVLATVARHCAVASAASGRAVEERSNFVMNPVGLRIRLTPRADARAPA